MHGHSNCNLCKCVDEHELKGIGVWCMGYEESWQETNKLWGRYVRAKIASVIVTNFR